MPIFSWAGKKPAIETKPEEVDEEGGEEKSADVTLEGVQADFNAKIDRLTETIQGAVAASKPLPDQPQRNIRQQTELPPEVRDEDVEAAYEDGDFKLAMKLQRQQRERDKLELAMRQAQLESNGMTYIGALTRSNMRSSLTNFKKYEGEIDQVLGTFDESIRGNPEVLRGVYDMVRGRHVEDEMKEALEESRRQMNLDTAPDVGNNVQRAAKGVAKKSKGPKTVEEAFGADAAQALSSLGRDADEVAKKMGYDNFAHYAAASDDLNETWTEKMHKW